MKIGGITVICIGFICALWVTACYVMRFTYVRALAQEHPEAYLLARDSAHALATDFFLPSLFVCVALMVMGMTIYNLSKARKRDGTMPE
jgi:hypothetical protein